MISNVPKIRCKLLLLRTGADFPASLATALSLDLAAGSGYRPLGGYYDVLSERGAPVRWTQFLPNYRPLVDGAAAAAATGTAFNDAN